MKGDEEYLQKVIFKTSKIFEEYIKFWAIIKLAKIIEEFELNRATSNEQKKIWHKEWFSPFETLEKNIKADSIKDNPLTIVRAPNGIWKTFLGEKDIYINIFYQSLWYTTAEDANLRIYSWIYMLNRMQSSSQNDHCLSALWLEWTKLDNLFNELREKKGNSLVYFDETGSTTDENNEFKIISSWINEINNLERWKNVVIRLSTHNQKIVDYYKNNKKTQTWFYTFDDKRNLEEWERDSDTLNTFKRLLWTFEELLKNIEEWKIVIDSENWKFLELDDFIKKILLNFISEINLDNYWKKDKTKFNEDKKNITTKKLGEFISFWNSLINDIEKFLNWEIKQFSFPDSLKDDINIALDFTEKQIKELSQASKWFHNSLYDTENGHQSHSWEIQIIEEIQWRDKIKQWYYKIIWKYYWNDDFESYNERDDWKYKKNRQTLSTNYDTRFLWYSNISWYKWIEEILETSNAFLEQLRTSFWVHDANDENHYRVNDLYYLIIQRWISNIPLIKERQKAINELSSINTVKIEQDVNNVIDFLSSCFEVMQLYYFEKNKNNEWNIEINYAKKVELTNFILDKALIDESWLRKGDSKMIEYLKRKNWVVIKDLKNAYEFLNTFCNTFNISIDLLLSEEDTTKYTSLLIEQEEVNKIDLDKMSRSYKRISEQDKKELSKERLKMLSILEKYNYLKDKLLNIFTNELGKEIEWLNITLDDFISWKYNISKDNDFESSEYHFQMISNFIKYYNDENIVDNLISSLDSLESPLLKWLKNYYEEILWFIFWNITNSKKLVEYLEKYKNEYKEEWFFLWRSYWESERGYYWETVISRETTSLKNKVINLVLNILDKKKHQSHKVLELKKKIKSKRNMQIEEWLPNMTSETHYSYIKWIISELNNIIWFTTYSEYVKKVWLTQVNIVKEKTLMIKWTWSNNAFDEDFINNDVELTPEYPIEIINWFNSSWKTEYIKTVTQIIDSALNFWYVNAESMTIWWLENYAYIDRIVTGSQDFSSWEQDILHWMWLFEEIKDKDLVIINIDEIFSTMDKKFSTAFAYNFVGKLLEIWKLAIIISHNHDFVDLFKNLPWVKCNRFDSSIDKNWEVTHTYKKVPWAIKDSAWVQVLKSLWIWKEWLK